MKRVFANIEKNISDVRLLIRIMKISVLHKSISYFWVTEKLCKDIHYMLKCVI